MMLPTSSPEPGSDDKAATWKNADTAVLTSIVRSAFPDLSFAKAILEERGGDHRVLVLDATYAFRFPRETTHDLSVEIAVLSALRGRIGIGVPDYRFVNAAGGFAGYRFIPGHELTPRRFVSLPHKIQNHVLDQAGHFLAVLHALVPEEVLPSGNWPAMMDARTQAADDRINVLPAVLHAFPQLAQPIEAFYDGYERSGNVGGVIVHGDLVQDHILMASHGQSLAGIIDFGDVALGDPAQDLFGFWAYGRDAVARVIAAYGGDADGRLLARSRGAFIRYRIDRFAQSLESDGEGDAAEPLGELNAMLANI